MRQSAEDIQGRFEDLNCPRRFQRDAPLSTSLQTSEKLRNLNPLENTTYCLSVKANHA